MILKQTAFRTSIVLAVLGAASLAGCASMQSAPLSLLDGDPPGIRASSTLAPLTILSVDGKSYRSNPVQVAPGMRSVVLQWGPGPNPNRQYSIPVEPCTRYFLAAERESVTARTWEMKIVSTEPVAACDPAEERRKAGM